MYRIIVIITKFHIKDDINDNVFSYLDYEMYFDSDLVHAIKVWVFTDKVFKSDDYDNIENVSREQNEEQKLFII